MPLIKRPPSIDISHWIDVPDFTKLDPMPWLIGTKATQGTYFLDPSYGLYSEEIRMVGARLLSYHFMDRSDPIKQAEWFSEIVLTAEHRPNEPLACDMEMDGISMASIKAFLDRTQIMTGTRPIIYTTESLLEALYIGGNPPIWLKNEWVWIAEYSFNPDTVTQIPSWIIPYGLTVNNIAQWQYTDDGVYPGIPGNNVDLNMLNPLYTEALGLSEPVPETGEEPMSDILYYADLKPGLLSNVRNAPGLSAGLVGRIEGPATISIVREKITKDGYDWYEISSGVAGYIAMTGSYTNFRPADVISADPDRPVRITIETASGKIYISTEFSEQV